MTLRVCRYCNTEKPMDEFYRSSGWKCKTCKNTERRKNAQTPEGRALRSAAKRRHTLKKYNLTAEEFDAMLADQDGVCAICKQECTRGTNLSVDHNHETGEVRGLLCRSCNLVIGYAHEDVNVLLDSVDYLNSHRAGGAIFVNMC